MSRTTEDPIVIRIIELMAAQHITQRTLTAELGLTNAAFTKWKNGENRSYLKYMDQLSKILNVSVEYLMYGDKASDGSDSATSREHLIKAIEGLTEPERQYFLEMIKGYKKLK